MYEEAINYLTENRISYSEDYDDSIDTYILTIPIEELDKEIIENILEYRLLKPTLSDGFIALIQTDLDQTNIFDFIGEQDGTSETQGLI